MKVMAIDASTKSTGVAIFDNSNLITYKCLTCSDKNALDRIPKMVQMIMNIYNQSEIDKVIMEDVIPEDVNHNDKTFKPLIYLQGLIRIEMNKFNQEVEFYISSEWRKKCGIKTGPGITRDMLKSAAMRLVASQYGVTANDDICDAICIGYAYTHDTPIIVKEIITSNGFEFK